MRGAVEALKGLGNKCNILEPETVKSCLTKLDCSINRKEKLCEDLDRFYKYKQISWVRPHYRRTDTLPFVPTTQEITALIACLGPKMSVFTLLLRETGCRFNEGYNVGMQDFNPESNTVTITPLKGSNARQLKVSPKLLGLLTGLPRK